jgi:hypothetical protein
MKRDAQCQVVEVYVSKNEGGLLRVGCFYACEAKKERGEGRKETCASQSPAPSPRVVRGARGWSRPADSKPRARTGTLVCQRVAV